MGFYPLFFQYSNIGNVKKLIKVTEVIFLIFLDEHIFFILTEMDFSGMPEKHKEIFCVSII